jgi:hypothetical protein
MFSHLREVRHRPLIVPTHFAGGGQTYRATALNRV